MNEIKLEDIRVQNGIVGFFDILGYKSFLTNNNPAEQGVKEVLKSLIDIPEINPDIRGYVVEGFSKHKKDIPPEVYPKLNNTEMFLRAGLALIQKHGKQARIGSTPPNPRPPSPPESAPKTE